MLDSSGRTYGATVKCIISPRKGDEEIIAPTLVQELPFRETRRDW
jgi:hypothetical protein